MRSRGFLPLLLALALPWMRVHAQDSTATITGRVTDSAGAAIAGADVSLTRAKGRARTDSAGRFRIPRLAAGPYAVTARRFGYHSVTDRVTLHAGETRDLGIRLPVLPVPLDTIVSEARATSENLRLAGFTQRERMGFGQFLTRDDIARMSVFDVWDVLRRVPFLTVVERAGGPVLLMQNGTCRPRVYVDGLPMPRVVLDGLPADIVDGIEVYRHATDVPVEFSGGRVCGAVLIWTR